MQEIAPKHYQKVNCKCITHLFSFQNIMTEPPREELNLLVIFWCTNEKSLLWNISFLFSIARFGGIVYCCPSCLEIFRAAQCWNAPETPSDEDSIVIFWNLISALLWLLEGFKYLKSRLPLLAATYLLSFGSLRSILKDEVATFKRKPAHGL